MSNVIIHSENCLTASFRKKCRKCRQAYYRELYKCTKRRNDEAKISLRSDKVKRNKYMEILCLECKQKEIEKIKDLCKICLKEYGRVIKIESRKNIKAREKENQKVEMNNDLRGLSKVGSKNDFRVQTDGNLKSMCEREHEKNHKEENKSVIKSMLQVKCGGNFKDFKKKRKLELKLVIVVKIKRKKGGY